MQQVLDSAGADDTIVLDQQGSAVGDAADAALTRPTQVPLGRRGQLRTLRKQLVWCDHAVRAAQREARRAMTDESLTESQRWDAVRRHRTLAWKVCREVLPLVGKVPAVLQAEPEYIECQRVAHALRRTTEDALRDNGNYTVDLVAASMDRPTYTGY